MMNFAEPVSQPGAGAPAAEPHEGGALDSQFLDAMREVEEGELVKGIVVSIGAEDVVVDIGYKSEGVIPRHEFLDPAGALLVSPGQEIHVYLERREGYDGEVLLSYARAARMRTWDKVLQAFEGEMPVEATVLRRVKGGLMVDLGGLEAFLPGSQVGLKTVSDLDQFVGRTLPVRILKLNKRRANVVVSRRALLEVDGARAREDLLATLQPGERRSGIVKTLTAYGAFIDLGGVDGLLHITDMSWGRLTHPSQVLKVEQTVEVAVLAVDREKGKISLGLKQCQPDPWTLVNERFTAGAVYEGSVTTLADYGAFIQLAPGLEGLVHVSEVAWGRRVRHPGEVLAAGQTVKVKVLSMDPAAKRMSLSIRQAESDPWETVPERYPVGMKLRGTVRGLAEFGAFIEVEEGIEGLVHLSDLSWSRKTRSPAALLKRGDTVDVVVLGSDRVQRRLSLGIKQLQPDPWLTVPDRYRVGETVPAVITNVTSFGAFAALDDHIEGLVPLAHLSSRPFQRPDDVVAPGQQVWVKVTRIQPALHKIALSIRLAVPDAPAVPAAE